MPLTHFGAAPHAAAPATVLPSIPRPSDESAVSALQPHDEEELDAIARDDAVKVTPALVRMTVVAGLGGLMFGYDTGCVAGALVVMDLASGPLSAGQEEWIVSSALVGALFGSLAAGRIADLWGRKTTLLVASALLLLGSVEQAAAMVFKEIVLGRIIVGLGIGLASACIPLYLSELSPAKYRGRIVASLVVLITGGQVLAYIVDAVFFTWKGGWRYMIGLGAVPALAQLVLSCTISESPRYLILHNRLAPARKTLKLVYSLESDAEIHIRVERIQAEILREREEGIALAEGDGLGLGVAKAKAGLLKQLWTDRGSRKALILACGLQGFQQATGFNCMMYYSGKILVAAHFSNPATFAIVIAVSNFLCTIVALRLIDHTGRRSLLLRTIPGMVAGMFFTGLSFIFIKSGPVKGMGEGAGAWAYFGLFSIVVFCSSYALGLGNVPWVVQSEVFYRYELRAVGTGLATATNWLANLIVAATFLHLSKALTPTGAFWLYSFVAILAWLFSFYYLPETKGLDLEAMRALFEGGGNAWDVESGEGAGRGYVAVRDDDAENADDEGDDPALTDRVPGERLSESGES